MHKREIPRQLVLTVLCFLISLTCSNVGWSEGFSTNAATFPNPPGWLRENRVYRVVEKIQRYLEWDIRRVKVHWYTDQNSFQKAHGFDSTVVAASIKTENSIHLGPRVTMENFDRIFGHELVHIILYQKYKEAIPKWLEEGLANYVSGHGNVEYRWLSEQKLDDVRSLVHPYLNVSTGVGSKLHYQASTALIEMIASKCSLNDLLQLSTGQKLEGYLGTYCKISDINTDFKKWLEKKSPRK